MARRGVFRLAAVAALLLSVATPAGAKRGASGIELLNNSGETLVNLSIRRTGTRAWLPLSAKPAKPPRGSHATATFVDPDCAFDLKATLEDGKEVVWPELNLCEVKLLTLNRNEAGVTWADYE